MDAPRTLHLLLAAVTISACSPPAPDCRVGADCASGMCRADGTCVVEGVVDGGTPDQDAGEDPDGGRHEADGGHLADAGPADGGDAGLTADGGSAFCTPNHDGTIERSEVTLAPGLRATFRIAQNATWSTAGVAAGDGARAWDLSGALSGDLDTLVETKPVTGQWFEPYFPGATYASQLSAASGLLGVFEQTDDALLLRGVASSTGGVAATRLTYSPPVKLLAFPITEGAAWQTHAQASGLVNGVFSTHSESYDSRVDAHGSMKTPFGTFPVLRVRTLLTRTVGVFVTQVRSQLFTSECYGVVAAVTSRDNEPDVEFEALKEARRLSP